MPDSVSVAGSIPAFMRVIVFSFLFDRSQMRQKSPSLFKRDLSAIHVTDDCRFYFFY